MVRSVALLLASLPLIAQPGIPLRPSPTDYATRNVVDGITVAASVVPPEQVRKLFSKDLTREGYVVVEVAVYPAPGVPLDVSPDEFTLKVGENGAIQPSQSPAAIAAGDKRSQKQSTSSGPPKIPDKVHVYNTATIGYESRGPYGGKGGVYTGTETTVAVGNPPYPDPRYPPSQPAPPRGAKLDWTAAKQELEQNELPACRTAEPVAGYLYFLKESTKEKRPEHQLVWYRTAGQIRLSIPAPK